MALLKSLELTAEHKAELQRMEKAEMTPVCSLRRARILLYKAEGLSDEAVADRVGVNEKTVAIWVNRYNCRSPEDTVSDILAVAPGRGRKPKLTGDAYNLIVDTACVSPKDFGLPEELWTIRNLTKFLHEKAGPGMPCLANVAHSAVYRVLQKAHMKPWQIAYYCEKRDPEYEVKRDNVLRFYKLIQQARENGLEGTTIPYTINGRQVNAHFISFDEKPGIQAIGVTAKDLPPIPTPDENGRKSKRKGGNGSRGTGTFRKGLRRALQKASKLAQAVCRDYEYRRYGTVSLLAGLDLMTGYVHPHISETHKSKDYIEFLKKLDSYYPKEDVIVIILDNLQVHKSIETVGYLAENPDRFYFVFTPKHASWLNMVESFFSKVQRCFLHGLRVNSKQELIDRLYAYIERINKDPVIYHWEWGLEDIDMDVPIQMVSLLEKAG